MHTLRFMLLPDLCLFSVCICSNCMRLIGLMVPSLVPGPELIIEDAAQEHYASDGNSAPWRRCKPSDISRRSCHIRRCHIRCSGCSCHSLNAGTAERRGHAAVIPATDGAGEYLGVVEYQLRRHSDIWCSTDRLCGYC